MLKNITQIRFVFFILAAMVLSQLFFESRRVWRVRSQGIASDVVFKLVDREPLPISWDSFQRMQAYIYFRNYQFGIFGDLFLQLCAAISLCLVGMIGSAFKKSGEVTQTIRLLAKSLFGVCCVAFLISAGVVFTEALAGFEFDVTFGAFVAKPFSSQTWHILYFAFFYPLILQLFKTIEAEASTV